MLINDCYNANPMSMRAALDDLDRETRSPAGAWRCSATCSSWARASSATTARSAPTRARAGSTARHRSGRWPREMARAFAGRREVHAVPDAEAAAELLAGCCAAGDTVLVKGSRGVGLERVAEALRARDPPLRLRLRRRSGSGPAQAQAGRR